MSAYAPFYDSQGRFVGVIGVDMWVRDFNARIGAIRRAGIGAFFCAVAMLSVLPARGVSPQPYGFAGAAPRSNHSSAAAMQAAG